MALLAAANVDLTNRKYTSSVIFLNDYETSSAQFKH